MEKIGSKKQRPHAVCVPYPVQGHINPMMNLAKILHSKGFHVTFVNTHYNRNRLLRARGPTAVDGLPTFRFESIPDGLEGGQADVTQDIVELSRSIERHGGEAIRALVARLNDTASSDSGAPHVTCVVLDVAMFFCYDVAEELGVPAVVLWPAGGGALMGCAQFQKLLDMGIVPFKDFKSWVRHWGHINPMMSLSKILHSRGFNVTFVNTHYNHSRMLRARGPTALDGLPTFQFESIPDGLPGPEEGCGRCDARLSGSLAFHGTPRWWGPSRSRCQAQRYGVV